MTVILTIAVVAGLVSQPINSAGNYLIAYLNPFSTAAHFISGNIPEAIMPLALASQILLLGLLGIYGLLRLRVNPEWSNR